MLDVLSLQETKLDYTFTNAQYSVKGFKLHRKDYHGNSGGLMMFIGDDIAQRRRHDIESVSVKSGRIEIIIVEIVINKEKWLLLSMYKQPKVSKSCLQDVLELLMDKVMDEARNIILFGDLNVNMLISKNCLEEMFRTIGVKNVVTSATCYKSNIPTLIDLLVTNVPKRIQNVSCIDSELSDFHLMVLWSTKMRVSDRRNKTFNESMYLNDLSQAPFHVAEISDTVDDSYWFYIKILSDVINEHVPIKSRKIGNKQLPYMNNELRKCINVKNMLRRRYNVYKSKANWKKYIEYRKRGHKLRRKSLQYYISKKCDKHITSNGREFWETIKPLISEKRNGCDNIILLQGNEIINDPVSVGNLLNEYYIM